MDVNYRSTPLRAIEIPIIERFLLYKRPLNLSHVLIPTQCTFCAMHCF